VKTVGYNFETWWEMYNRAATDSDRLDNIVRILSTPLKEREQAAYDAWMAAWKVAERVAATPHPAKQQP
jgi:hypothetical protein